MINSGCVLNTVIVFYNFTQGFKYLPISIYMKIILSAFGYLIHDISYNIGMPDNSDIAKKILDISGSNTIDHLHLTIPFQYFKPWPNIYFDAYLKYLNIPCEKGKKKKSIIITTLVVYILEDWPSIVDQLHQKRNKKVNFNKILKAHKIFNINTYIIMFWVQLNRSFYFT